MPVVFIPSLLRSFTGGTETVPVVGRTVGEVIDNLDQKFPGIKGRLLDDNGIRPGIAVAVGTDFARRGLSEPVSENSEVHFLPAISGGLVLEERQEEEIGRSFFGK